MSRSFAEFARDKRGGIVLIFALLLPVVTGMSAAAVEYGSLVKRRSELQRAADSGAIAGVNQFKLANTDDASAVRTAIAMARAQAGNQRPVAAAAEVVGTHSGVRVTLSETIVLTLGRLLNLPSLDVRVQSTAKLAGTTRLCLLALDGLSMGAFHLESAARITASDCSLYSNSINPAGIQGENAAVAQAISICSAGGYAGRANFSPQPATGCPVMRDPLAHLPAPRIEPCLDLGSLLNPKKYVEDPDNPAYGKNIVTTVATLNPGTYCGGLHITKGATVTLRPGVYVMKDGPLVVDKKSSLEGVNVGFYFTGPRAGLLFDEKSVISLTAPKEEPMRGLLFFEERNLVAEAVSSSLVGSLLGGVGGVVNGVGNLATGVVGLVVELPPPLGGKGKPKPPPGGPLPLREYRIISDEARTLLGTIYLPSGRLIIDSKRPVADQSAYTVIIARLINLYDGPNLVLNARYGATDVPVPRGVGPSSANTELSQ
ncbi:hypothetical protein ASF22_09595 [Methylobacterium sp. Leaf87]|uniref:TadE/TadG family type IV pilus assembly protein n=1 Tax=Methylobacterium sp. Leaf87 TaxID=1736243 RepID=UPI0006F6BEDE|nr:TadE/TadG family type IV pilus assembly protein [Methylobacterium sp. Leaf87]KQO56131.1 hypothetical protein ASF22_09595 [Methylobacterium sp. Leaf87]